MTDRAEVPTDGKHHIIHPSPGLVAGRRWASPARMAGMIAGYASFAAPNWRALAFGGLIVMLSSFGQTYYISLFGAGFRSAFHLSDGGLGALYGASIILSALTLSWVGRLIDHTTVRRYTWFAGALLGGACMLTALAPYAAVLAIGFYCLRLGGEGLMMRTAVTATARHFPADAGKALGIVMIGFGLAQAVFPPLAVMGIGAIGWRAVWFAGAVVVVGGVALATTVVPGDENRQGIDPERRLGHAWPLLRDRRLYLALPAVLAAPFIGTGFFFHQVRLAQEKGWPLSWLAGWFAAFAVVHAATNIAAGPLINRMGPRRMLPVFLIPLAGAMWILFASDSLWAAPIYLMLIAVSAALAGILATTLWVELYGPDRLARVRSAVEAALVIATGASPVLVGYLIDRGVPLSHQALGGLAYIAFASLLALRIARVPSPSPAGREPA